MRRDWWGAAAVVLAASMCGPLCAQAAPAAVVEPAPATMDMAAVIALLQQQQKELAEQRARLDAQAGKITALTRELDALRTTPGTTGTPQTEPRKPAEQVAQAGAHSQSDNLETGVEDAAEARKARAETIAADQKTVAAAQADDPTQDLLTTFPGAWRLPGTESAFKVGGFVRTAIVFNRDVLDIPDQFIVGSIPVDQYSTKENAAQSSITANQSRLNFDYREATDAGILRAFIEGDFTGNGNSFRLRHAFGQWDRVLAGQTWSAFVDTNATPEDVDFEGLNGRINVRQSQVRFSPRIGEDFEFQLSLEDPNPQLQNGNGVTRVPDLVIAGSFQPSARLHLRTALLGRQIRGQENIQDTFQSANVEKSYAWGLSLSGSFVTPMFDSRDKFLFQLNKGNAIGRYVNDLNSIGNYDGIFDPLTGNLQLFDVFAGYGSLQHWWNDTMRSNFTFGWVDIDNPGFIAGDAYKRTLRSSANFIWNPIERINTGVEYLWGQRENKDGDEGEAQQLQLMLRYLF